MTNNNIAIRVKNISKCYRIGVKTNIHDTFGSTIIDFIKSPLKNYRKYRSLYKFEDIKSKSGSNSDSSSSDIIWALRDVSFEVKQGEVLGIIGRNGAGKSTLLKILSRITEPISGSVEIHGKVSSLLEVGTGFNQELTGRENIYLNGTILGMKKKEIDRKFDEIIDFSGVEKFIDTPVKRYSSGMSVRLAFAVAAHLEPEILIIDEVLAVGDVAFQKKCLGKMENVAKEGRTILFVSHNIAAISNLCQRVVQIHEGSIVQIGESNQVIEKYLESITELRAVDLSDRKDREGLGEIRITSVQFINDKGIAIEFPRSGETLTIRVHYQCIKDRVFRNCAVRIGIIHAERVYINLATDVTETRQLNFSGKGYIDVIIPELPLSSSVYYLDSYIESDKLIQDYVRGAAKMSVVDGDFHGTGKNYIPGWAGQYVLVKHWWKVGNSVLAKK